MGSRSEGLDRVVSIRLSISLVHELENRVELANETISKKHALMRDHGYSPRELPPLKTLSDAIRHTSRLGLDLLKRDPELVRDYLNNDFAERLVAMLALAVDDEGARDHLAQICKAVKSKPEATVPKDPWD